MEKYFSIKKVALLSNLPASTIRYYEAEGLIQGVQRNHAGIRQFTLKNVAWIKFLAKLKSMEMPLIMMKQYAYLRKQGNDTIDERIALLLKHKAAMKKKIESLYSNIALLENKIHIYEEMKGYLNE